VNHGVGVVVKRAFRYRFYPSSAQEVELSRTFGCVRLVYNRALEARTQAWFGEHRRVNYAQVVIEDLAVRNMVKNRTLARAISDASWSDLRSMLEYKCGWHGRDLVVVDRWLPSSKTCSACGHLLDALPLRVRE
jgi:IS605 OrfB family transposase